MKNPIASKAKPAASRAGNRNKAIAARVDQELDAFPYGSATALARALRTRKVSAVELLKATLGRVDRINPRLNAIVVDDRERAMAAARTADRLLARGELLGPLHGLPMTVKEAAQFLGVSTQTVYLWVERKQIPHFRVMGRNIRFLKSDLRPFRAQFRHEVENGKTA